jgi:hypothetical protein
MNYWHTDKFLRLQKKWDKKLAKSGFVDAERRTEVDSVLKSTSCNMVEPSDRGSTQSVGVEAKRAYFELLADHVLSFEWTDRADELIMRRTSEGMRIVNVSKELKRLHLKCERKTIRYVIRKYESLWKIRKWTPAQLTYNRKKHRLSTP